MTRIFVVGFSQDTDEAAIRGFFGEFGDISWVKLITDQRTGKSKCYAFIDYLDKIGPQLAIREADGSVFNGRILSVKLAENQPRRKSTRYI